MNQDFLREGVDRLEGYVLLQDQIDYEDFSQDDDVGFDYFISAEMVNEGEFEYGKDPIYNIRVFIEDGRVKHRYKSDFRRKTPTMNGSYPSVLGEISLTSPLMMNMLTIAGREGRMQRKIFQNWLRSSLNKIR